MELFYFFQHFFFYLSPSICLSNNKYIHILTEPMTVMIAMSLMVIIEALLLSEGDVAECTREAEGAWREAILINILLPNAVNILYWFSGCELKTRDGVAVDLKPSFRGSGPLNIFQIVFFCTGSIMQVHWSWDYSDHDATDFFFQTGARTCLLTQYEKGGGRCFLRLSACWGINGFDTFEV